MSTLGELKLVAIAKPSIKDPILVRRTKFIERLEEQIALVTAKLEHVLHHTNAGITIDYEGQERVRTKSPWWWEDKDGKTYLAIKYGSKVLEIQKGKTAIVCEGMAGVKKTLETIQKAAYKGELDALLQIVGGELRKRFSA